MNALTCSFCGRISTETENWRQAFVRPFAKLGGEKMLLLCPKCYKKFIENNIGTVLDPDLEMEQLAEAANDNVKQYIGMMLRDFLCSEMYLTIQNIYFQDKNGQPIKSFMPCMDARIRAIARPNQKGQRMVTLDYILQDGQEDSDETAL